MSEDRALRHNEGKLRMDLIDPSTVKALAEILTIGAEKYDEHNWKKGDNWSVPYASLMRHLMAFWGGENLDPESSKNHLKHALANISFLLYYYENYPELDNRYKVNIEKTDG